MVKDDAARRALMQTYEALAAQVDVLSARAGAREDVVCGAGCDGCCQPGLTVGALEAARVRTAASKLSVSETAQLRDRTITPDARCVFLLQGRCAIYDGRPMVCRSQGLPLLYDAGIIPAERLSAETQDGRGLAWCPLNYQQAPPRSAELLDAAQVDRAVATLNIAWAKEEQVAADTRVALRDLARESST